MNQKELILNTDWDILLILDSCRYDIFKNIYKEILGDIGNLKKTISPSAWTLGWAIEIFNGESLDDVIFISANPDINSKGHLEKILDLGKRWKYKGQNFDARNHFKEIIDVWEFGYDKSIDAVHPKTMIDTTIKVVNENSGCRFISKFNQIHDPYLYYLNKGKKIIEHENFFVRNKIARKGINLRKILNTLFSDETIWKIQKRFGYTPSSGIASMWLKYGKEGIIKGHTEDLRLILKYIKEIIDCFSSKTIVITSDHGELLGEYKRYGHHTEKRYKELIEVPWFEIWRNQK